MAGGRQVVLSIETTAPQCGVAIAAGDATTERLLAEGYCDEGRARGEQLADLVETVLDRAGVAPDELSAIAVVTGPGSYTGLRIGLALARGLAMPGDVPVVPFGALELLAAASGVRGRICALLDAGRCRVYAGRVLAAGGGIETLAEPELVADQEVSELVASWADGPWTVCADAEVAERVAVGAVAPAARAAALAVLGVRGARRGRMRTAACVLPAYIGASGARPNRNRIAGGSRVVRVSD